MKKNPKISIIVPIYNAEKYLERCMESIYAQTFNDYEIILVNDGSQDSSAEICRAYQEKDERITFIDKKNEGAGSARNAGIEVAIGTYLAFPDVDDWFERNMYEELYLTAESGDYDVVFSGVNYYKQLANGTVEYSRSAYCEKIQYDNQEDCRKNIMTFFPTSTIFDVPWNKLYKRSVLMENGIRFTHLRRCQDAMFNIEFYNHVHSVSSTDKAYYNYIENTVEGVRRKFPQNYIDINIIYFSRLIELLSNWGIYKNEIKEHYDTSYILAIYETMKMYDNPLWNFNNKEKKQYVLKIMKREEVRALLQKANVRKDAKNQMQILQDYDYLRFFYERNKDKIKNRLRRNEWLIKIYYAVVGKK